MNTYLPIATWLLLIAFFILSAWWLLTNNGVPYERPTDDDILLDFLDQAGYSVQHLETGEWAVTDAAHAVVGTPADTVRDAVRSAINSGVGI